MPAPYDYSSGTGYARARPDWVDFPSTSTPIQQVHLDQLDQAVKDLKDTYFNVLDWQFDSTGATSNTAKWNTLMSNVPSTGAHVHFPPGKYLGNFVATGKNNLKVTGAGSNSVLHNTTASVDALYFNTCLAPIVENIRLQGTSGTRHGLQAFACPGLRVSNVWCAGTGQDAINCVTCIGVYLDNCIVNVGELGPYPTSVVPPARGLVLGWNGVDVTSGCNSFVISGGIYIVGQSQGAGIFLDHAEVGVIDGPVVELSGGGIYMDTCEQIVLNGYYGEFNPRGTEYTTGTVTTNTASTAVTGAGTTWTTSMQKQYLRVGTSWAKIATVNSATSITLASNWPITGAAGLTYSIQDFSVHMKTCKDCKIVHAKDGGALALENSDRNVISAVMESLLIDASSTDNDFPLIVTNRSTTTTGRIVDNGARNKIVRQISYQSGAEIARPTVASAATITIPYCAEWVSVSGTTTITSVAAGRIDQEVTLQFQGILTFTDGSNLKLAGNFVTTADDTITLICDGTNWWEKSRSVN